MAIASLKSIELFFRRILNSPSKEFKGKTIHSIQDALTLSPKCKILILRPDKFGDMIVSLPMLRELRNKYPEATIDIVLGKANKSLKQQAMRYVNSVLVYDKSIFGLIQLIRTIRSTMYDVCVDPLDNPSTTTGYLSTLSAATFSVGIYKSNAHKYSHCVIAKNRMDYHIVERTAQVLLAFGINPENVRLECEYNISNEVQQRAIAKLENLIAPRTSMIAVNIAGSVANRTMNEDFAIPLIKSIKTMAALHDVEIVVFGTKHYELILQSIQQQTACIVAPFTDSFDEFAAMLHCASLIVSPDTSVVHLAAAWKTPTLCLFCADNTGTALWTPYHTPHIAIITKGGSINEIDPQKALHGFKELTGITPFNSIEEQSRR